MKSASYRPYVSVLLIFLSPLIFLFGQNTAGEEAEEKDKEQEEKKQEDEKIRSLREQREQTLSYGIDSQVLELISNLKSEENTRYNEELVELFGETTNSSIRKAIVEFFEKVEEESLVEEARKLLEEEWEDMDVQLDVALISYLETHQDEELSSLFMEMSESPRSRVANEAIKALGKADKEKYTKKLRTMYEEAGDNRARKSAALEAIGELEAEGAIPLLEKIVLDEDEEKGLRWKACVALGNIGTDEALEVIIKTLEENDPRLRQFAVQALGKFSETEEIRKSLIQALKDNSWRVRVEAARSIGEIGSGAAVDILKYKAEHDPDTHNVRTAAVRALGKIGNNGAHDFLKELYESTSTPLEIRGVAIEMLIEHDLSGSIETIKKVMGEEWDEDNSKLLDYTCKQLSRKEDGSLKPLFARMLGHPSSLNIKIYALRGIRLNGFSGLKDEVEKLTGENVSRPIRKLALSVMEEL